MTFDFFFGGAVSGGGLNKDDSKHVLSYAHGLLTSDESDDEAIAGLRGASGRNLRALQAFAVRFERPRRSANDPLVRHVEQLVVLAAKNGTSPPELETAESDLIEQERELLRLKRDDAFARLADRYPTLAQLANTVSDPAWAEGARANPALDGPEPPPLPPLTGLKGMYLRRLQRRWERDPKVASFRPDRETKRLMAAFGEAVQPVIRQMEESSDPILRTLVAHWIVITHLGPLAGVPSPPE
jgi:hypothetical protein